MNCPLIRQPEDALTEEEGLCGTAERSEISPELWKWAYVVQMGMPRPVADMDLEDCDTPACVSWVL